ncbi:putative toxin-antitoxin system toxin component, PIN family [Ruminococcus sp.]|uniref:putative toxin-antitoxin system toxin component, PIN family n=1 Tax=Ruminococcus sp. TaxID=41978 RepID=UPI002E789AD4|nr:putative toxin-antitoxin system toxin component, PIN family [Ruminococcus sp.]MEE0047018.1 putative toxin-antitoxin system toxin component, PIN family [Ruminococcus sp.]
MKILIDTNILISAALNPYGTPFQAYIKAVSYPNDGIVCEQNIDELRRIFNRKFASKMHVLDEFLALALPALEIVPIPDTEVCNETKIRDVMDRPIFRAAIEAHADIILTGDKDFLEAEIDKPKIMTAADFLNI